MCMHMCVLTHVQFCECANSDDRNVKVACDDHSERVKRGKSSHSMQMVFSSLDGKIQVGYDTFYLNQGNHQWAWQMFKLAFSLKYIYEFLVVPSDRLCVFYNMLIYFYLCSHSHVNSPKLGSFFSGIYSAPPVGLLEQNVNLSEFSWAQPIHSAILCPETIWRYYSKQHSHLFCVHAFSQFNSKLESLQGSVYLSLLCAPCFRETAQPTGALLSLHEVSREAPLSFPFEVVPRAYLSLVNYSGC